MRLVKRMRASGGVDYRADVRAEYVRYAHVNDASRVRILLSEGNTRLTQLEVSASTAGALPPVAAPLGSSSAGGWTGAPDPSAPPGQVLGRMGVNWPWRK